MAQIKEKAKRCRWVFGNASKDDTHFTATVGDTDRNNNVQSVEHATTAAASAAAIAEDLLEDINK